MYFWLIFIIDIVTKKKLQNASWLIIWEINMQNSENKMFIPQESPHMIWWGISQKHCWGSQGWKEEKYQ